MTTVEKKVDAMARMLLGVSDEDRNKACNELCRLLTSADPVNDREHIIHDIFKDIGVSCANLGYEYLVEAICMVIDNRAYANGLTIALYPKLAARFDTTASRVERAIRHSIERVFLYGDPDILFKYFGNTVSAEKGKPTNGEFISQIANTVKLRLKK